MNANDLYDRILQIATLPALLLCVGLSIIIIKMMMSPKWIQARRNKQIRKAVEERKRAAAQEAADAAEIEAQNQKR